MPYIEHIIARQVLDSRGLPTVEVEVHTKNGAKGKAIVPSGASTGLYEAHELRDNLRDRFLGKSVFKAVKNVNDEIAKHLLGVNITEQRKIDNILIQLDGTENKSRLGANALLAVSLACASCASHYLKIPLYRYIGGCNTYSMPIPMMNIINGGKHASNNLDIQEFMIVPINAQNINEAIEMGSTVFHHLKKLLHDHGYSTSVGDEGGFAPDFKSNEEALDFIIKAIRQSGYKEGKDICIALDVAGSELYKNGLYYLNSKSYSSYDLIQYYEELCEKYPIISIEDGLDQDDFNGWKSMSKSLKTIMLVGDDLFVTNQKRLSMGIQENMGNAILIKPNQIGTLSETLDTITLAKKNKYKIIISHRSGESEDTFIADLAVGTHSEFIKTGSMSRSERIAKYNQLLRIDEKLK